MGLLIALPGAVDVLAAQARCLPQPDQLCGPFAAHVALHAVLAAPPSVLALALAAGTRVWPHDVDGWRPAGAPFDTTGWASLPRAASAGSSGTDAAGVAAAVSALTELVVLPVRDGDGLGRLLATLVARPGPVGVVANVHTATLSPELGWDVGHFVVLHGYDAGLGLVAVADTYRELGTPDQPPGCRVVPLDDLRRGLAAAPGRGLLLLVRPHDAAAVRGLVEAAGVASELWTT